MKKILILLFACLSLTTYAKASSASYPTLSTSTLAVPERNLTLGQRGSDVKTLQNFLVTQGYLSYDAITGYFGIKTKTALAKLQKENGIASVGKFGPVTRDFIKNKTLEIKPIGGSKDSHGCLVGAGYAWDSSLNLCQKPWEKLSVLLTKDWVLQSIDGKNYSNLTFKVIDGSVSARACNSIFGKLIIDDTSNIISAPILASTKIACDENLMYQDAILDQTLATKTNVTFDLNSTPIKMNMVGGGHTLVFTLK